MMSPELTSAIEKLYSVFRKYGLHAPVKGCEHCVFPEDIARIQAKPLRQLSAEDLERYAFKALTTWGEVNDFKHFLPRLFELSAEELKNNEHGLGYDIHAPTLFDKLSYGVWAKWPNAEQKVIHEYLFALWKDVLQAGDVEHCLISVAQTKTSLAPYLNCWIEAGREREMKALVEFGYEVLGELTYHRLVKAPYWNDCPEQARELTEWLYSEATVSRLETFSFETTDTLYGTRVLDLAGYLQALRP